MNGREISRLNRGLYPVSVTSCGASEMHSAVTRKKPFAPLLRLRVYILHLNVGMKRSLHSDILCDSSQFGEAVAVVRFGFQLLSSRR